MKGLAMSNVDKKSIVEGQIKRGGVNNKPLQPKPAIKPSGQKPPSDSGKK
ncbi:MAG: hypothetical protein HYR77_08845 [Ignavibacteria bacterium]|nr:hypothetical protein [Ignavibacteria bacterium]